MTKVKVPKRIAGVKVPKKLRKQAKKMLKASASPVVQDLALAGLTLAATRMLDGAKAVKQAAASAEADKPAKSRLHGLDFAAMIEAAAAEGARRFLDSWQAATAPAPEAAPAPKAPKAPPAAKAPAPPKAPPKRRRPGPGKPGAGGA